VDDNLAYTLLGLLVVEEYGLEFTAADVGKAWLKHLPHVPEWAVGKERHCRGIKAT
jgi:hypothetical protein